MLSENDNSKSVLINQITINETQISTCVLHMLNARLDKIRHRSAFSLTQGSQTAAKHLI